MVTMAKMGYLVPRALQVPRVQRVRQADLRVQQVPQAQLACREQTVRTVKMV